MIELAYSSTANWLFSGEEIEEILQVSRRNNARDAITGVLMYRSGSIVQLLEGEVERVRNLYRRLQSDPRHSDLTLLYDRPLTARRFAQWSMAFQPHAERPVPAEGVHLMVDRRLVPPLVVEGSVGRLIDNFLQLVR